MATPAASVDPAARRTGRPRNAQADVAILQAVLDLVGHGGLTHLNMDAVAAKAGVGKATIYRRWPSKEALVVDAWRTLIAPFDTPDTGALRGDVEILLGTIADKVSSPGFDVLSQIVAASRTDAALAEALRDYVVSRRRPMRNVLVRALERGELRTDTNLDVLHDALVGPLFYRILMSQAPIDQAVVRSIVDLVLTGAAPAAGRRR